MSRPDLWRSPIRTTELLYGSWRLASSKSHRFLTHAQPNRVCIFAVHTQVCDGSRPKLRNLFGDETISHNRRTCRCDDVLHDTVNSASLETAIFARCKKSFGPPPSPHPKVDVFLKISKLRTPQLWIRGAGNKYSSVKVS